ncbi:MAG: hypothetical protein COB78_01560 [Hyphomicrobiales bacterium]|nr:MAG: hypothetical protein COB78_01560 [Hyphomicrobiales bacterium]
MSVSSQRVDFAGQVRHLPLQEELQDGFDAENVVAIRPDLSTRSILVDDPLTLRLFNVIASSVAILLLSPFFLVIFILVRLETSGAAINAAECSSRRSFKFDALSFRCTSLINNVRVPTRVGAVLQRSGLAQLPLLFNVLKGHISFREIFIFGEAFKKTFNELDIQSRIVAGGAGVVLGSNRLFWITKRLFDIAGSVILLPILGLTIMGLLILNPFMNPGKLFFIQKRMGKECRPFFAIKFRSMRAVDTIERGPNDPIEVQRITFLGKFIRRSRLDELPQILNVIFGEMSLIGPRPDYYTHAIDYLKNVPGYRDRHIVRPGISGLAQVSLGYVEGTEATRQKVNSDHSYISEAGFVQEGALVLKTIATVLARVGE